MPGKAQGRFVFSKKQWVISKSPQDKILTKILKYYIIKIYRYIKTAQQFRMARYASV